jgi:hypothetical protein
VARVLRGVDDSEVDEGLRVSLSRQQLKVVETVTEGMVSVPVDQRPHAQPTFCARGNDRYYV